MTGATVRVAEIFTSIQGEGVSAGRPSVFVRLQGCAVGCAWCDTKYSWDAGGGEALALDEVLRRAATAGPDNAVVTGGEPLENPAFGALVAGLKARGLRVEVETAGTEPAPPVTVDQWNVSLKLAHSGVAEARRRRPDVIAQLRDLGAWFKFVVAGERDLAEIQALQAAFALPAARILLMPLGMRREEQLERMPAIAELCRRHGYRFSPRLHILIWGPKRGV